MAELVIINDFDSSELEKNISLVRRINFYYSNDWLFSMLKATKDDAIHLLKIIDNGQNLAIICIQEKNVNGKIYFIIDIRNFGFCLFLTQKSQAIMDVIKLIEKYAKSQKADYLEWVNYSDEMKLPYFDLKNSGYDLFVNFDINIPLYATIDDVYKNIGSKKRNNIRKGIKDGIMIREVKRNIAFIDQFYPLYQTTMGKQSQPGLSYDYLKVIIENNPLVRCFIAEYEEKVSAAGVFIFDEKTKIIHYKYGATKIGNVYGMDLIIAHVLISNNNYQLLNMGATSASFLSGVYNYKKQWNGNYDINVKLKKAFTFRAKIKDILSMLLRIRT